MIHRSASSLNLPLFPRALPFYEKKNQLSVCGLAKYKENTKTHTNVMSCERHLSLLEQGEEEEGEETLKTIPINQNNKYLKNAKLVDLLKKERYAL